MEEKELYSPLLDKLANDYSLEKNLLPEKLDLENIRTHLIKRVSELMTLDFDRFLNSLYRIDVSETKVREVLHSKDKTQIPEKLADLIIERQLARVRTQILYKQGKL